MKKPARVAFLHILIAMAVGCICTSASLAQEYMRDSEPKLLSYDELVQLSLDQEMNPELTEKLIAWETHVANKAKSRTPVNYLQKNHSS